MKTLIPVCLAVSASADDQVRFSLIPEKPSGPGYDYFCTWAVQNYLFGQGRKTLTLDEVLAANLVEAKSLVCEARLTEPDGWLSFFPKVRGDLWFVLDDGYYVNGMDSMEIDPEKFPSCTGTPPERQATLASIVKAAGWRGLGLWSRGIRGSEAEAEERVCWAKSAGVGYWKVDGGDGGFRYIRLRNALYPELVLEHAVGVNCPYNWTQAFPDRVGAGYASDPKRNAGRLGILKNSDVFRTYDADQPLNQVTSLDRVAGTLQLAEGVSEAKGVINCEDNPILGAALGCAFGVFRFPYTGRRPDGDPELYLAGPFNARQRMDEVVRAVRWHRIAPPFAANARPLAVSEDYLTDLWIPVKGDSWCTWRGICIAQSAPARVARGLPLPGVRTEERAPFVVASRHPNGAVAIATLGRFSAWLEETEADAKGRLFRRKGGYSVPRADVTLDLPSPTVPIGIFGRYKTLTLTFPESVAGRRVWAQDLAEDTARDITGEVDIKDRTLTLSGELIDRTGLRGATQGDLSDPGLVLVLRTE